MSPTVRLPLKFMHFKPSLANGIGMAHYELGSRMSLSRVEL
jgi:hypothetical protein